MTKCRIAPETPPLQTIDSILNFDTHRSRKDHPFMQAEYTYFIKSSESETGFGTSPVTTNLYLQNNKNKNKDKSDVLNLTLTILEKNDSMFYLRKGSRRRTF